jgi:serine/threonine protein kinase
VRLFVSQPFPHIGQSNDSELSDIYSMGVLMWEACSKGKVPYERRRSVDNIQQRKLNDEKLRQPKDCPNELWSAVEYCWLRASGLQLTFDQLKIELLAIDFS